MTEIARAVPGARDYVLAAKCTPCRCSSGQGPHLSIDLQRVELDRKNAAAISYTWGEFDRRHVYIGHADINPDKRMFIELGLEWSLPELWNRLSELSAEHNALWIDQLCFPQTKGEIRDGLARIPDIYRTLDVVAVLPGPPPCNCYNRWLRVERDRWLGLSLSQRGAESHNKLTLTVHKQIMQCYNSVAFCSWFRRVWTRQEFFYSKTIRIKWNLTSTPPCVERTTERALTADEISNLNPYARLFLMQVLNSQQDPLAGLRALSIEFQSFVTQGSLSTLYYLRDHSIQGFGGSHLIFPLFLTEEPLEVGSKSKQMDRFLNSLSDHSSGERSATYAKDYVVSIWVDCPSYTIPAVYESMPILELLQDAIGQLERLHSITLATTSPQGLSGGTKETVCWRPANGLQPTGISKSRHLYAPARTDTVLPLKDGLVPLKRLVYRVVASVLGLDHTACAAAGVRLVIAPETPALIGFTAPNNVDNMSAGHGRSGEAEETLTVWTGPEGAQKILYEAILQHNDGAESVPQYRVVGVWVPCKAANEDEIGAVPCFDDEYDVFLV